MRKLFNRRSKVIQTKQPKWGKNELVQKKQRDGYKNVLSVYQHKRKWS